MTGEQGRGSWRGGGRPRGGDHYRPPPVDANTVPLGPRRSLRNQAPSSSATDSSYAGVPPSSNTLATAAAAHDLSRDFVTKRHTAIETTSAIHDQPASPHSSLDPSNCSVNKRARSEEPTTEQNKRQKTRTENKPTPNAYHQTPPSTSSPEPDLSGFKDRRNNGHDGAKPLRETPAPYPQSNRIGLSPKTIEHAQPAFPQPTSLSANNESEAFNNEQLSASKQLSSPELSTPSPFNSQKDTEARALRRTSISPGPECGSKREQESQKASLESLHGSNSNSRSKLSTELPQLFPNFSSKPNPNEDEDYRGLGLDALKVIEDPRVRQALGKSHAGRSIAASRDLIAEVYSRKAEIDYDPKHGWMKDAQASRAAGSTEVGVVAELSMPLFRGNPTPSSSKNPYHYPAPDGKEVDFKKVPGIIVYNDEDIKIFKPFTTKSGTDPQHLKSSKSLGNYVQVIRSPEEDHVIPEQGVSGVIYIKTNDRYGSQWDVGGPRLMHKKEEYRHPHGTAYRYLGVPKGHKDVMMMQKIAESCLESKKKALWKGHDARLKNPKLFMEYRDEEQTANTTVVEKTRLGPRGLGGDMNGGRQYLQGIGVPEAELANHMGKGAFFKG